ncbi:MAG TPA: hypothetical protein RMH85_34730 [Polyangiaceae bacterium LLY-WYZ-15_(1-7)]|nr:hypothetical protein [Myxococcales bacterium]MAT25414.1 hypothetical protein [Sandaracinus sp.]HJK95556.1 hypothetical protein [Polyangiaceae bacterium LLY-WYZ-15_(1-7)]MBJ74616.1 hypothetical protein [Sandaracinus sp.]HJL00190.1 hypothetical protein [Polyangiaceae bacterium LLY-WYZ-15_(1-7)]
MSDSRSLLDSSELRTLLLLLLGGMAWSFYAADDATEQLGALFLFVFLSSSLLGSLLGAPKGYRFGDAARHVLCHHRGLAVVGLLVLGGSALGAVLSWTREGLSFLVVVFAHLAWMFRLLHLREAAAKGGAPGRQPAPAPVE